MGGTFPVGTQLQGYALGMVTMKYTSFPSVTSGKMEKKVFSKLVEPMTFLSLTKQASHRLRAPSKLAGLVRQSSLTTARAYDFGGLTRVLNSSAKATKGFLLPHSQISKRKTAFPKIITSLINFRHHLNYFEN